MNYVDGTTASLVYTIPVSEAANNTANKYHVEVQNMAAGTKTIIPAATTPPFTAAVAATTTTSGTTGSVSFTGIPTPDLGSYICDVYYANNASLDTSGVALTKVGTAHLYKIAVSTSVTV